MDLSKQEPTIAADIVQIFYLTLVGGGYALFLVEGLPHLPNGSLGSVHIYLSGLVVLAALHSFITASTCSPGVLLPRTPLYKVELLVTSASPNILLICRNDRDLR